MKKPSDPDSQKTEGSDPAADHLAHGIRVLRAEKNQPLSEVEAEARLHQEGYESFRWHDVPGVVYPRHRHEQDECLWVLEGVLDIALTDAPSQTIRLQPGDRIYLPARFPHRASTPADSSPNGVTYLVGQKNAQ